MSSSPLLGEIMEVGFSFPPRGWAFCDGQLLPIAQNTALFSLLGTTYGGNGSTNFALPDLRGRVSIHPGSGPGLSSIVQGQAGGTETHTLTLQNLPSGIGAPSNNRATHQTPAPGRVPAKGNGYVGGTTGSSQAVSHRDPYLGNYHCIALQGIFPSRN